MDRVPRYKEIIAGLALVIGVPAYFLLRLQFPDFPFWLFAVALVLGCIGSAWMIVAWGIVPLLRSLRRPPEEGKRDA